MAKEQQAEPVGYKKGLWLHLKSDTDPASRRVSVVVRGVRIHRSG